MRPSSPFRHKSMSKAKENLTVTVRFRPLSLRERKKGDEIEWYADGECSVRNDSSNPKIGYAFDHVFGPAATTRCVYDAAAHHVVSSAMNGINGTIFAYGVTSSGKTHTMHGVQKSPGIIPLAVKHVFEFIQETPGREFLLRVSYLEIYNEVINDLLDPTAQNLRIREDTQGTFIEGVKEEVVLSPAHALSLIATGEEHRHVGSNNFNLLSSRSHTIFTLTIESSPCGQSQGKEDVTLSQLHLIDLAGSESSKTETNGLRRKEGSYINKSLLTLGTVISKLTEVKATHIPYRDSKLTRLLQSSLSGYGRISLICTVTPASSNSEETHNTLKFAHRSKHVEINASQNKIMDEKSLIKKYQKEILDLKQELQIFKHGMIETPCPSASNKEGSAFRKHKSNLDEEEQVKAALMGRIQRLTNLILVSTKNSAETKAICRKGHFFGEDELAYLPDGKRNYVIDSDVDGDGTLDSKVLIEGCGNVTNLVDSVKGYKKHGRKGMLGWFKARTSEHLVGLSVGAETSTSGSPYSPTSCSTSSRNKIIACDVKEVQRKSVSMKVDESCAMNSYQESCQVGLCLDNTNGFSYGPQTGTTIADHLDPLDEQVKCLAEEVAMHTSSLKRLSQQEVRNTVDPQAEDQMQKLKNDIAGKKLQIRQLEQCTIQSLMTAPQRLNAYEMSQQRSKERFRQEAALSNSGFLRDPCITALTLFAAKLSEKTCELEIKSADNRILQEQLELKAAEIEDLKIENTKLAEVKDGLNFHSQKMAEEASFAKELAGAAAVELQHLTEEVTKLSYQNAELIDELESVKEDDYGSCRECRRRYAEKFC